MSFVTTPGRKSFKTKGTVKGIKNMYLAGQWTMAPGGLPVAAVSGKFAVQRILKSEHKDIKVD
jgi:phytoene dehydrogenase-like protein